MNIDMTIKPCGK